MIAVALALFYLFAIAAEASIGAWRGYPLYDSKSTETNLGLTFFGWVFVAPIAVWLTYSLLNFGYAHRAANLGSGPFATLLLILVADFLNYCRHVANHYFRWMWATHFVHHSDRRLNFLTYLRENWTDIISGSWLIWAPLGFLGFSLNSCVIYFVLVSVWQMLVHNRWMGKLGILEWVLVTPSHHRVHHSTSPEMFNYNYGGLLIVWDRLFGTFKAEPAEGIKEFGLADYPEPSLNLITLVFAEWRLLLRDLWGKLMAPAQQQEAVQTSGPEQL